MHVIHEHLSLGLYSFISLSILSGHMEKQEMEVEWKLEMENGNGNWKWKWKCANRWHVVLRMRKVGIAWE